jgi:hypothetical protein
MRSLSTLLVLLLIAGQAKAESCNLGSIAKRLEESLDGLRKLERDVSDIQSTEGGIWQVFREKDGRVHSIIRGDYGESGRNELRFSAVNRSDYGIASTRFDYIRHAFVDTETPFAIVKRTTEFYFYCGGRPYLPPPASSTVGDDYERQAIEARNAVLDAKDVSDFTKGYVR